MRIPCNEEGIARAAKVIRAGGTVVFPTDTVYGIGCDPRNIQAVKMVYAAKKRDPSKPLPVLAGTMQEAERLAVFDVYSKKMAARHWPGMLTMVLELADHSLNDSMNLGDAIALRIPKNACAQSLLEKCGPLVGTSANISGQPAPSHPEQCTVKCDLLLDGGKTGGAESTIVDARGGKNIIIRGGAVPEEML